MDFLRRAHYTPVELGQEWGHTFTARWFECSPGAQAFPDFHAFINPSWEDTPDRWTEGPGVRLPTGWAPKNYRVLRGDHYHGPLEWYQRGIPSAILDNLPPPPLIECGTPQHVADGGALAGGAALVKILRAGLGGAKEGGSIEQHVSYGYTSGGGEVEGGSADYTVAVSLTMGGGSAEGGSVDQHGEGQRVADGGSVAGGTAGVGAPLKRQADGGSVADGTALFSFVTSRRADGGSVAGGTAGVGAPLKRQADGGSVADGTAPYSFVTSRRADGGSVAGGTARVTFPAKRQADGGSVADGTALLVVHRPMAGGEFAGGSLDQRAGPEMAPYPCPHVAVGWNLLRYKIQYSGWPPELIAWNEPKDAISSSACRWDAVFDNIRTATLRWDAGANGWLVELTNGGLVAQHFSPSWDGSAPTVFTQVFNTIDPSLNTTVLVEAPP